jgi:hypothetical protein
MDEVLLPAPALGPDPALDPEPALDPDPALDVDPRLDPKPPKFGLVGTLQNVAVISSWQIMPVLGSSELFVVPPAPNACCRDCATTGEDAKSSADSRLALPGSPSRCFAFWFDALTVNGGAAY